MNVMGRPRAFDPDVVAMQVVDLVLEHGYDAVGIDDIVRVSGVGRGSIYQTFGSKAGLIAQALGRVGHEGGPRLDAFVAVLLGSSSVSDPGVASALHSCLNAMGLPAEQKRRIGAALLKRLEEKT
jgi:AcrR family transcriptional regulator